MKETKKTTAKQAMPEGKVPKKKRPFSFRKSPTKSSPLSTFDDLRVSGRKALREAGD
tara:strand:- start:314 stop:484 length:171 start_codon:yes stop_codon:yes gene_type:complete